MLWLVFRKLRVVFFHTIRAEAMGKFGVTVFLDVFLYF